MKKGVIIAIVAVVLVVAVVVGVVLVMNNQNKGGSAELNLQELNTTISSREPYSLMTMQDIDAEALASIYEITENQYDEVIGKMPMINVQASMYLVIKAKPEELDSVKQKVEAYGDTQERVWATYLPEQYELVKQRKIGVVGNYVYLIICENAADIEALINK